MAKRKQTKNKPSTQQPTKWRACGSCRGTGQNHACYPIGACETCRGRGKVLEDSASPNGMFSACLEAAFAEIAARKEKP